MLRHEFFMDAHNGAYAHHGARSKPLYKFHVLLTSYETLRDDLELLGGVTWRVLVVDEAHRLKNKDSAVAAELRALKTEQTIMLTGTPLQVMIVPHCS